MQFKHTYVMHPGSNADISALMQAHKKINAYYCVSCSAVAREGVTSF
jgi:hypothetical protein